LGKRSSFKRIPQDAYSTPESAVGPLLPRLALGTRFIEPCAGEGFLVGHLKRAGHVCIGAYDLPIDARTAKYEVAPETSFITNPPFWGQRADLHPLICNLSNQAPAWLLMNADWLFNVASGPLVALRLRKVVAVGRVRWIAGSKYTGMENVAWMLFDAPDLGNQAHFIGREGRKP
jgi:hypothetical protein